MQSDPEWIANGGVQDPGEFTMFGGTITALSGYTNPPDYEGDTSTSITVYFTADSTDSVLAWGGHIAERDDWGIDNSAVFISGSPYHMRLLNFYDVTNSEDLGIGNTDRSLSTEAVVYPAEVTIVKEADPEGDTPFDFSGGLGDFSLVDDGAGDNFLTWSDIVTFRDYTITESIPSGWDLKSDYLC